jgi:hypothetical protein
MISRKRWSRTFHGGAVSPRAVLGQVSGMYRWIQIRDWLPTDALYSRNFYNYEGACPGFKMRSNR